MIFRIFTFLLTVCTLLNHNILLASCGGCSRGQSLVTEATAAAATAGLPGIAGAAGLPGLAGLPGAPGIAGPAGTPGLPGGLLDYAMVFAFGQSVDGGDDILWNEPDGPFAPGTTFSHSSGSGDVVVNSIGTYLARYIVSVAALQAPPTAFAIYLGGTLLSGSDRSSNIPGSSDAQLNMAGEVIFRVDATEIGTAVSVRNISTDTAIGASVPSLTAASLFLQKLSAN